MAVTMAEKPLKDYVFEQMAFAFSGRMMDQVVIQVLERTPTIAYFGDSRAALRGGLFVFEQTGAVGILLSVGEVVRYVYASWLDFQRDSDRRVLHLLENQDCLMVRFFGSNFQQARIFVVENTLRDWLATARTRLAAMPPWTAPHFAEAVSRAGICCGHANTLWRALQPGCRIIELDGLSREC
ncbi:hypothetical protein [Syntrophotalea acetylenica]|uniref:Uncharacterized protein n=1 Tax=Syntrophotalea acetylenica TaxID=29542 RepID=A0A1L3GIP5_SYNAC|nr:hypothetical protein [Syntrophotalea acetylenica]APG25760.1 hypothetical protein A7E75_12620 [Syntrophotalea acetylenica]APG43834.1 hypothetical protein A6070_06635 [Syntrophotalea acetylenica]